MTEAKVRQQYNRFAAVYDQRWHRYVTNTLEFLKTWVQISPTERVLDIACGTGEFERMILAEYSKQEIMGVDISEQMLAIAQQKIHAFPNVSFQTANASALPFADNSFDVVVSANAFHYFDDPAVALQEMKRVLKPMGRVVILDWCKDFVVCQIYDVFLKFFDPAYRQCYRQAEFHQLLTTTGFRIEGAQKVRFGWIWGLMIATITHK
ncbi:MAG: methyltransferase domain-containing protein [Acaryochloris sp. RU_4_1]|nr:methyltransferase domain-containing protein [Acaryochloris sp. RU_4_1]NJR56615.1 methyltransferase domain-containing protein [Acaryochloris sp. CRU_2_0]